mgnify:CR=1 FL=1
MLNRTNLEKKSFMNWQKDGLIMEIQTQSFTESLKIVGEFVESFYLFSRQSKKILW